MPTMQITDPVGLFGQSPTLDNYVMQVPAGAAVAKYALVAFVMATDGVLTVVEATTGTHDPAVKVGGALNGAATGEIVDVVCYGPCIIKTPATGPAISEVLILTGTAGVGDGLAADATAVAGDTHGVFLTDEIGTSDTAWVFITG